MCSPRGTDCCPLFYRRAAQRQYVTCGDGRLAGAECACVVLYPIPLRGEKRKMRLSLLLENLTYTCMQGDIETEISSLVYDSRKASEGCLFV